MTANAETPTKPYLIRALYEWCLDNGHTPYLAVTVNARTRVPLEFVKNGEIVLNVGADAVHNLAMGNDFIEFAARFNGVSRDISIPMDAVSGIYARESGQGMAFEIAPASAEAGPVEVTTVATPAGDGKAAVKSNDKSGDGRGDKSGDKKHPDDDEPPPPPGARRGRPKLQIVK